MKGVAMIGSTRAIAVYAYAAPVDMRKSYEGEGVRFFVYGTGCLKWV